MNRPFENKSRYLWALIIGTFIFIFIFILSHSLSYLQFYRLSGMQDEVAYEIFEDKLIYGTFGNICSGEALQEISQDLSFQGRIIDDLERKLGKNNENVLARKKFYSLVEVEHYEFINDFKNKCGRDIDLILFFYSNEQEKAQASEDMGRILGFLSAERDNLFIYSFDVDLNSSIVSLLKEKYDIDDSPTLIVNDDKKLFNPQTSQEIERHLDG